MRAGGDERACARAWGRESMRTGGATRVVHAGVRCGWHEGGDVCVCVRVRRFEPEAREQPSPSPSPLTLTHTLTLTRTRTRTCTLSPHPSPFTLHPLPLTSRLSPLTSHLSPPTSHLPPPTSHLPPPTSHLSPLTSHPSPQAKDQLKPGAVVKGSVTSVRETGAIVKLPGGVDGLLHVSQVSEFYVRNVTEILGQGDDIYCIVIAVDSKVSGPPSPAVLASHCPPLSVCSPHNHPLHFQTARLLAAACRTHAHARTQRTHTHTHTHTHTRTHICTRAGRHRLKEARGLTD